MWNLSIYIVFVYFWSFVRSDCLITYPDERKLMPSYRSALMLKIPYNNLQPIEVPENEEIYVSCLTKIKNFKDEYDWSNYYEKYKEQHSIEDLRSTSLVCRDGQLQWAPDGHKLVSNKLTCEPMKWSLYSDLSSNNCGPHQIFYKLGTSLGEKYLWLGQLCYDMKDYKMANLTYYIGPHTFNDDHNELPILQPEVANSEDLPVIKTNVIHLVHINDGFLKYAITLKTAHNPWLSLANYKYHSLVQGKLYTEYFMEYNRFLDIPWWEGLRHGNWKRFTHALEQQANEKTYFIRTGTSGAVEVPSYGGCTRNRHLHMMVQGVNVTVPAYIWSYIEPVDDKTDGVVVIGYNSPYFEFFSRENLILCTDICDTIDWLKDIRYSFNYTNAGVVFCCSPNEIWEKKLLDGFPAAPTPITILSTNSDELHATSTDFEVIEENEVDNENE